MTTVIALDGGLGRIITSIPALLRYHQNHLNEEWYVMVPGWDFIMWGIPELQDRTFNPESKGSFDIFLKADQVITPEPYRLPSYYRHETSLKDAFDELINNTKNHNDLPEMKLVLSNAERRKALEIISEVKEKQKRQKTIVLQPYGSTAVPHFSGIYDDSLRSIPQNLLNCLIENLSKNYNLIFMGAKEFHDIRTYKPDPDPNLREWAAIIEAADYFIGCDSCGQHMCKALNKRATVFIAGTHRKNVSYEEFHIIEKNLPYYSDAMRISAFHSHLSSRLNEPRTILSSDECMNYLSEIMNILEDKKEEVNQVKTLSKSINYNYSS